MVDVSGDIALKALSKALSRALNAVSAVYSAWKVEGLGSEEVAALAPVLDAFGDMGGKPEERSLAARHLAVIVHSFAHALRRHWAFNQRLAPRYDGSTGRLVSFSREVTRQLCQQRQYEKLKDTIEPDLVLHLPGQVTAVFAVYDLKFPCVDIKNPDWRKYAERPEQEVVGGHQGRRYQELLQVSPQFISPPKVSP